jgi:hypothetical protein
MKLYQFQTPREGDVIIIPFNRPRRYCPLWVANGWMDGRNVFIKNGAAAKKDWEIIKGVKEKRVAAASEQRGARAQFEMIEEREKRQRRHQTKLYYSSAFGCAAAAATRRSCVCVYVVWQIGS